MAGFVLIYERPPAREHSWIPLLQHQATIAVARAILSDAQSEVPALSRHVLLVPAELDILPLLAIVARDFASFAEPEGEERSRAPFLVYDDQRWQGDAEGMEEMQYLLHPAWFRRLGLSLSEAVSEFRPENCIVMGDPGQIARRLADLPRGFQRIVHFEHLAVEGGVERLRLPGEAVAADRLLDDRIRSIGREIERGPASTSMWQTLLSEGDAPDLEPFVAFGPATEMSLLIDRD
jgi:hypothetical protein